MSANNTERLAAAKAIAGKIARRLPITVIFAPVLYSLYFIAPGCIGPPLSYNPPECLAIATFLGPFAVMFGPFLGSDEPVYYRWPPVFLVAVALAAIWLAAEMAVRWAIRPKPPPPST